jgi:hypothetical protein
MSEGKLHPVRQEEDRIKTAKIVGVGVGALLVFGIGIYWAIAIQRGKTGTLKAVAPPAPYAGKLEVGMVYQPLFEDSIADRKSAPKRQRLNSVGWADPEKKHAHIPIDRAMELVIQKGKL